MDTKVAPFARLIEQFERLPGIGHKSAQRLAFHVLSMTNQQAENFAKIIVDAHEKIHKCEVCCDLTDSDLCCVCSSPSRDRSKICVVEDSRDVMAIERTHEYDGLYHVLHGAISPMNNIDINDITVNKLIPRLDPDKVKEVIMATSTTVEGEATAMYISRLIKPLGIKITRLAYGVPVGANLEYADEYTLVKAMEGRKEL
ncbi:MAG: recombination mediator RecR [Clostridiales bacterium]|nr:recombination mediator RecR [Clostridiales bacterium]